MSELKCPLCGEDSMEYKVRAIRNYKGDIDDRIDGYTHVWSCKHCPAVLTEYYGKEDYKNLGILLGDVEMPEERLNK